jgi:hypothetical protein
MLQLDYFERDCHFAYMVAHRTQHHHGCALLRDVEWSGVRSHAVVSSRCPSTDHASWRRCVWPRTSLCHPLTLSHILPRLVQPHTRRRAQARVAHADGGLHICWPVKCLYELLQVFQTRFSLHTELYQASATIDLTWHRTRAGERRVHAFARTRRKASAPQRAHTVSVQRAPSDTRSRARRAPYAAVRGCHVHAPALVVRLR